MIFSLNQIFLEWHYPCQRVGLQRLNLSSRSALFSSFLMLGRGPLAVRRILEVLNLTISAASLGRLLIEVLRALMIFFVETCFGLRRSLGL